MSEQAIQANQKHKPFYYEFLRSLALQMWFPLIMYFWIVPALFPYQDPNNMEHEVVIVTWESFFIKMFGGFCCLALFMVVLIYLK